MRPHRTNKLTERLRLRTNGLKHLRLIPYSLWLCVSSKKALGQLGESFELQSQAVQKLTLNLELELDMSNGTSCAQHGIYCLRN